MEWLVGGLAVVGGFTLISILMRSASSTARVLKAANLLEATTGAAIEAARQEPDNDARLFAAVTRWEEARSAVRSLTEHEQALVSQTLRDRGLPQDQAEKLIEAWKAATQFDARSSNPEFAALYAMLRPAAP